MDDRRRIRDGRARDFLSVGGRCSIVRARGTNDMVVVVDDNNIGRQARITSRTRQMKEDWGGRYQEESSTIYP